MAQKVGKPIIRTIKNILVAIIIFFVCFFCYNVYFEIKIYFLNRAKLNDIAKVNKQSAVLFAKFVDEIEDKTDWEVSIISGYRSKKEQIKLQRENPSNAASSKSRHVMGRAIDINLYKRVWFKRIWLKKFNSKKDWRNTGVTKIAAKYNLLWGGSYRNYHDPVHFEIH